MTFALSTNWNNQRLTRGEAIVDEALSLGFGALELGYQTTAEQVAGFKARLDEMPVGSVHAFCPVPLSAPRGYPELYSLADFDENVRGLARVHVRRNVEFAAEMGATALVLHAGRVPCRTFFRRNRPKKRERLGRRLAEIFARELEGLLPLLEKNRVALGLENLPYLEGFPNEEEMARLAGEWVRPWLDTGHDYVRQVNDWRRADPAAVPPLGMHLNDSNGGDDHLPPGEGKIDFAALLPLARSCGHLVFEPHQGVEPDALAASVRHLKTLWQTT